MASMTFETVPAGGTTSFGMVNPTDNEVVSSLITLDDGTQHHATLDRPTMGDADLYALVAAAHRFLKRALNVKSV